MPKLYNLARSILKAAKGRAVAVYRVRDGIAWGGARSAWVQRLLESALITEGGRVIEPPKDWDGRRRLPKVELILDAAISARMEKQVSILDVHWRARRGQELVVSETLNFPSAAAPKVESPRHVLAPRENEAVHLSFDARPGGMLCDGERTTLRLKSERDLHVRVLNLFADGGQGLLLLPDRGVEGRLKAGKTLSIGPFRAIPLGSAEQFLVVAAPTRAGLGWLGGLSPGCRLTPLQAGRLAGGDLPKDALVSQTGFRVVQDPTCPVVTPNLRRRIKRALKKIHLCQ